MMIFIETLGSNVDEPVPPGEKLKGFYGLLENSHGFSKTVLRTDYRFTSNEEAQQIFGFFFW